MIKERGGESMISLKEIAKVAGVDVSTVSRALSDSPRVRLETKEKIKKLAEEYNYIPDDIARGLVGKKTLTVGIIIPEFINTFYAEIIEGMESVLSSDGYTMLFGKTGFQSKNEMRYLDTFMRKRVDGIIACSVSKEFLNHTVKQQKNIPIVLVDAYNCSADFDSVSIDNAYGVQCVVEHLLQLGHKQFGFIGDRIVTSERLLTYNRILKQYGVPVREEYISIGDERYERGGYLRMQELLNLKVKPTAVFAVTDNMAIGAVHAVKEAKLRVPEDISIVGFDDIMVSSYLEIPLTTVLQPKFEMGRISAGLILDRMNDANNKFKQQIVIKPELIVRNTTTIL
jgi:DNA-binding LacI/PurR family transcriptional regulator